MAKLVLLSLLVATGLIPFLAARDKKPRRGFRRAIFWTCVFNAVWMVLVLFILPRLG